MAIKLEPLVRWCTGRSWFTLSYLLDWLISGAVLILNVSFTQFWWVPSERYLNYYFILSSINVLYVRFLPNNNPAQQFPMQGEVLPSWVIVVLTMMLPVAIFLVFQIAIRSAHDFHHACLGLFEVLCFNIINYIIIYYLLFVIYNLLFNIIDCYYCGYTAILIHYLSFLLLILFC